MKFIVDENLPVRLAAWLTARGYDAAHVTAIGFRGKSDRLIWDEALARGAAVISRDTDFIALAQGDGCAIRLTIGNCSTAVLLAWLESAWPKIVERVDAGDRAIEI